MQVMDAARDYRYRYVAEMHVHATRTLSTLSSRSESPRWRTDFNSDPIYKRMALATPEASMEVQLDGRGNRRKESGRAAVHSGTR